MTKKGDSLWNFDAELKADRRIVQAAVGNDGQALQFASTALRDDAETFSIAVQQSALAFCRASQRLQNEPTLWALVLRRASNQSEYNSLQKIWKRRCEPLQKSLATLYESLMQCWPQLCQATLTSPSSPKDFARRRLQECTEKFWLVGLFIDKDKHLQMVQNHIFGFAIEPEVTAALKLLREYADCVELVAEKIYDLPWLQCLQSIQSTLAE